MRFIEQVHSRYIWCATLKVTYSCTFTDDVLPVVGNEIQRHGTVYP